MKNFQLTKTAEVKDITSIAKCDGVEVDVNHKMQDNKVTEISCTAYKVSDGGRTYVGYARQDADGVKTFSLAGSADVVTLSAIFQRIFDEVGKTGK